VLGVALGCVSSSNERARQAYALRSSVSVVQKTEDVASCRRVASLNSASQQCANLLPSVDVGWTECAQFLTVDLGGDTLLVTKRWSRAVYAVEDIGEAYVCRAPILATTAANVAK
jgi:hypothetical protein